MENTNTQYWKGKFDELESKFRDLKTEIVSWKIAFGWSLAGIILISLFALVIIASLKTNVGYTPEQVTTSAIEICKQLGGIK